MHRNRTFAAILGAVFWVAALSTLGYSVLTVRDRIVRPASILRLQLPGETGLSAGDAVYLQTEVGFEHVGEVNRFLDGGARAELVLIPAARSLLGASAHAICWRAPLSVEDAMATLLPDAIRLRIADEIATGWQHHEEELTRAWTPLAVQLTSAYLDTISGDIESALRRREDALWTIAQKHGRSIAAVWPVIQDRLGPIMQQHLTPVLGRLINEAVADAPKVSVAWHVARGHNERAYQMMLDYLGEYLASIPESDRVELEEAFRRTWDAASRDEVVVSHLTDIGQAIIRDQELRDTLSQIYREAITDNPRTADFLRREVLESVAVKKQMYDLIEAFGPTARRVMGHCLFDATGGMRPEIVQLLRSSALGRSVSWVTLHPGTASAGPLEGNAILSAEWKGTRP